jgi:gluconokinase
MAVLVIDIGSSSVRALLFDDLARPIPGAVASRQHVFTTTPPGAAIAAADELRALTEACIDELLDHPGATEVSVVGMDTFVGNVVGVDRDNHPVTPVFTYADTRSAADVERLRDTVDVESAHQRTGCVNHTAYLPGRLLWLKRTEPELYDATVTWIDFGTYLYRHWLGNAACSYSVASWSGLLNRHTVDWDEEWLDALGLNISRFPSLADFSAVKTGLLPVYASRWPALREVPFCLAVGDGAAANVGSGCVDETRIALTVGTTAALRIVTTTPIQPIPSGLWSYRVDMQHHLIGGATTEGGNIFQWTQGALSLDDDVEKQLARREPDSHGLTFLPLLGGERSPGWAAQATGSIAGLRLSTTSLDILQAALEGVALRLSLIADELKNVAADNLTVIGGGGALVASPAWIQMIANALDCSIQVTSESEITARGVAILALRAIGKSDLSEFPPTITATIHPKSDHVGAMRAARERQTALYHKMITEKWNP